MFPFLNTTPPATLHFFLMGFENPHPFNLVEISFKGSNGKTLLICLLFLILLAVSVLSLVYLIYSCVRRSTMRRRARLMSTDHCLGGGGGLDKADIERLPVVSYGSGHELSLSCKGGECSICLGSFQEKEKVKVLPICHHGFHSECIDMWLKNRPSCPLCRGPVVRVNSAVHPEEDVSTISTAV